MQGNKVKIIQTQLATGSKLGFKEAAYAITLLFCAMLGNTLN